MNKTYKELQDEIRHLKEHIRCQDDIIDWNAEVYHELKSKMDITLAHAEEAARDYEKDDVRKCTGDLDVDYPEYEQNRFESND